MPIVTPPQLAGLHTYPLGNTVATRATPTGVLATRIQRFALVPRRPGEFWLPSVQLPWWDLNANVARIAHTPGHTLIAIDAVPAKQRQGRPALGAEWPVVGTITVFGLAVFGLAVIGLLRCAKLARWLLWLRLRLALDRGREAAVKRLLLALRQTHGRCPPGSLLGLSKAVADPAVAHWLGQLERHAFGNPDVVMRTHKAPRFRVIKTSLNSAFKTDEHPMPAILPPLYRA